MKQHGKWERRRTPPGPIFIQPYINISHTPTVFEKMLKWKAWGDWIRRRRWENPPNMVLNARSTQNTGSRRAFARFVWTKNYLSSHPVLVHEETLPLLVLDHVLLPLLRYHLTILLLVLLLCILPTWRERSLVHYRFCWMARMCSLRADPWFFSQEWTGRVLGTTIMMTWRRMIRRKAVGFGRSFFVQQVRSGRMKLWCALGPWER